MLLDPTRRLPRPATVDWSTGAKERVQRVTRHPFDPTFSACGPAPNRQLCPSLLLLYHPQREGIKVVVLCSSGLLPFPHHLLQSLSKDSNVPFPYSSEMLSTLSLVVGLAATSLATPICFDAPDPPFFGLTQLPLTAPAPAPAPASILDSCASLGPGKYTITPKTQDQMVVQAYWNDGPITVGPPSPHMIVRPDRRLPDFSYIDG